MSTFKSYCKAYYRSKLNSATSLTEAKNYAKGAGVILDVGKSLLPIYSGGSPVWRLPSPTHYHPVVIKE